MNKSVSIIVLNYNGKEILRQNLPILIEQTKDLNGVEIIIADNGSNDGTPEFIKNNFKNVKIIQHPKNYGFCKGLNLAAKEAQGELILFLNNDIEVTKDFLPPLVAHFDNQKVFGVSPKIIRPSQDNLNEGLIIGEFKGGVIHADFTLPQKITIPDQPFEVFSVSGAAFLVAKAKFFELGGFDELLRPFYYEETDLAYRALKRGWKMFYEPKSLVYHQHNQTIGKKFKKSVYLISYRKNQYLTVWKDIDNPGLLLKHFLQVVIVKLLIPNLIEWQALWQAVKQLPKVFAARKRQRPLYRLTDKEVFDLAKQQSAIIKKYGQKSF